MTLPTGAWMRGTGRIERSVLCLVISRSDPRIANFGKGLCVELEVLFDPGAPSRRAKAALVLREAAEAALRAARISYVRARGRGRRRANVYGGRQ